MQELLHAGASECLHRNSVGQLAQATGGGPSQGRGL
jgi:hypothetical protein